MKLRFIALVLVLLIAAAGLYLALRGDSPTVQARSLNVLLVTIDTLRADRVTPELMPNLTRLTSRGAAFQNVRATVPLTLPSHATLLTGTLPPVHGVRENGVIFNRKTPTIARILKDAGYETGAFVGAFVLNRRFGLADGFDTYDDEVPRDAERSEQLEAERPAAAVVDSALAWLSERSSTQPFFLWTHLYDPHAPYAPPEAFVRQSGRGGYDGEVAYADAHLGRLLDAIDSRGQQQSTLIVVTGDHGESLGEHGENTHGMLLYDGALRVPLVVSEPGVSRTGATTCHQNVAAMILELAGDADRVPGVMSRGSECARYAETRYPRRAGWHPLTSLFDGRWKLIAASGHELYELLKDPGESSNVAASHPQVVEGMAAALARLQAPEEPASQVAPDAAERLRALGYVGGSSPIRVDDPNAPNPARVIGSWTEFERALGLLREDRPQDAIRVLRPLASKHPEAQIFHSTLGLALREAGDARAALAVYRSAVAKWASDPSLFHDLAAAARDAGALDEAMRAEQAALALDDSSAMARNGLGLLHADAGRHADAVAAFSRATELDPTNASYWTNLGNARGATGDASGAKAAYRKALEIEAEFADALNGLGTLYVQGGRAAEAVSLFERALRRDPELHEARLNLGIALQESGQLQRAAETYRQLLATAPPSAKRERDAATALLKSVVRGS